MNKQRLFWQGISGGQRLCVVYWQVASCCDGMGMESSQDARTTERKAPGFYPMKGAGFWPTHARTPRPRRRQDACVNPMAPFIGRGLRQSEWSSHHLVVVRKNTPCGSFRAAPKFRKQMLACFSDVFRRTPTSTLCTRSSRSLPGYMCRYL